MSVCATCLQGGITVYAHHQCPGRRPLAPGDIIHSHTNDAFGRNTEACVRIEAVGPDWIVARVPHERWISPVFASGSRELKLCQEARDEPCCECPLAGEEPPLTTWKARP